MKKLILSISILFIAVIGFNSIVKAIPPGWEQFVVGKVYCSEQTDVILLNAPNEDCVLKRRLLVHGIPLSHNLKRQVGERTVLTPLSVRYYNLDGVDVTYGPVESNVNANGAIWYEITYRVTYLDGPLMP